MPSGKVHDQITWYCLPLTMIVFLIVTKQLKFTLFGSFGFVFSGLMFGPDLDIYSLQFKRWGFLKFIWLPYQKMLKHRSIFSHGFIIGTIIRVLYLGFIFSIVIIILMVIAQLIGNFQWDWQNFLISSYSNVKNQYWREILSLLIGLELGAMSHYLADNIGSWWKPQKRIKRKRIKSQK